MRNGTRKAIFSTIIKEIPYGTNKMASFSKAGEAVIDMLMKDYESDCREYFLKHFSDYIVEGETKIAKTVEEYIDNAYYSIFKTVESAIRWGAEYFYMKELEEGVEWLIQNGYIREWKKPARFGYRWYLGITAKGWKVAHLYK